MGIGPFLPPGDLPYCDLAFGESEFETNFFRPPNCIGEGVSVGCSYVELKLQSPKYIKIVLEKSSQCA